jgi:uncharacterized membrane protein YphA (DoxX/SURF4 family)
MVGGVFLAEGIQKFRYPGELGSGRFAKIGIPWPDVTGPFVGAAETLFGALVIVGLLTRASVLVLLVDISVAIVSTKYRCSSATASVRSPCRSFRGTAS